MDGFFCGKQLCSLYSRIETPESNAKGTKDWKILQSILSTPDGKFYGLIVSKTLTKFTRRAYAYANRYGNF